MFRIALAAYGLAALPLAWLYRGLPRRTSAMPRAVRARLLQIANLCPVHRTLTSEVRIDSRLV